MTARGAWIFVALALLTNHVAAQETPAATPIPRRSPIPAITPEPTGPVGVKTFQWTGGDTLVDRPVTLMPACEDASGVGLMLGAAWLTMEDLGWQIQLAQEDHFRAKACRGGPKSFCVTVDVFYVNGTVEVWEYPFPKLKSRIHRIAKSWVGNVRVKFPDVQCRDREELEAAYASLLRRQSSAWIILQIHMDKHFKEGEYLRFLNWVERYGYVQ